MVGNNVRGKCTECGDWWYTKEKDSYGKWIPEIDPDSGNQIINSWGKPQYKQHVHECRGASSANKATKFEKQLTNMVDDAKITKDVNEKNLFSFAADMAIVRSKTEIIEKDVEKIKMDLEAFLRSQSRNWYQSASELPKHDSAEEEEEEVKRVDQVIGETENDSNNDGDLVEEISETDDKTSLESHSINFVDESELPPK